MKPLSPEAEALRHLRARELNRQAQSRSRGTEPQAVSSVVAVKAPWLGDAIKRLMAARAAMLNNERVRKWSEANPEKARARSCKAAKMWAARNPEKIRAKDRVRYHTNPTRKANVIRQASFGGIKRRGLMYGVDDGTVTSKSWAEQLEVFGGTCGYCGDTSSSLHRDHVYPLSKGGTHSIDNLAPACQKCNLMKSARGPIQLINAPWKG